MKVLACDFDGTLYQNQTIQLADQQAIQRWQQKGHLFVFATGRDLPALQTKLKNYPIKPDHIIGNNGATMDQQILSQLEPALLKQLLKQINPTTCPFHQLKISGIEKTTGQAWQQAIQPPFHPEKLLFTQNIVTQVAVETANLQQAQQFALRYAPIFPQLTFLPNNQMVDIVEATTDKAHALTQLANQLEVPLSQVFTIGDGLNDVQMLKQFQSASFPWVAKEVAQVADRTVHSVAEWITQILKAD